MTHAPEPISDIPTEATPHVTLSFFDFAVSKTKATPKETTWRQFFTRQLQSPPLTDRPKERLPAFSPCIFSNNYRKNENAQDINAIVLDYDNEIHIDKKKVPLPLDKRTSHAQALSAFDGLLRFGYSSPSHTADLHKHRLVLVTSRVMTQAEFVVVLGCVYRTARDAGHVLDEKTKDAGRLWFFKARRNDNYEATWCDGKPLDVDAILAQEALRADVLCATEDAEVERTSSTSPEDPALEVRIARATNRIRKWEPKISGDGSSDLLRAALHVVRGYEVPPDDALAILRDHYLPKVNKTWTDEQIRDRVADAEKYTAVPLGFNLRRTSSSAQRSMFGERAPEAPQTDWGNALRLSVHVKDRVRYVPEWKSFVRWSGKIWERDSQGFLVAGDFGRLTEEWMRNAMAIEDVAQRATALGWALKSQGAERIRSAVTLLKSVPEIRTPACQFDDDPFVLNTPSGVLRLRNTHPGGVEQVAHDSKYLCTKITLVGYSPEAKCPTWQAFLISSATTAEGKPDPELVAYRRRRRGSYLSASPDKILEVSFDAFEEEQEDEKDSTCGAKGNSGKTTYYATCAKVLGTYADKVDRRVFEQQKVDQHPTHLAELEGLRFAFGAEISNTLDIEQVKDLTGERTIKARKMQQDMRSFTRTYKLAAFANSPPRIHKGNDDPIWNRVLADCWHMKIEKPLPEGEIDAIYAREAEGILADMVVGWVDYHNLGMKLNPPDSIRLATTAYQSRESPLAAFIAAGFEVGAEYSVPFAHLWECRQEWTKEYRPGQHKTETEKKFAGMLTSCGYPSAREGKDRTRVRRGLRQRVLKRDANVEDISVADLDAALARAQPPTQRFAIQAEPGPEVSPDDPVPELEFHDDTNVDDNPVPDDVDREYEAYRWSRWEADA